MKVLKNNSLFITLSFINKKLYKRIFFSLFVMTAAAFTELITLYIAYPVFALLSGETENFKNINENFLFTNIISDGNTILIYFIAIIIF